MQAVRARPERAWTEHDDALLLAILSLREIWREREGHVSLADLALDARCATFAISGLCPKHGQFVTEWIGRPTDALPLESRCPAAEQGRCAEMSPVFVLV